jgi:aminopeptidase N
MYWGNEQFRKVITDYLHAFPYDNVRSGDLEIQCMRSLGMNMQWFFDQWVYRAGYPVYIVTSSTTADATSILVKQAQDSTKTQGLFRMPIVCQVHYTDGGFDEVTSWISERETTVVVPNAMKKEVAFVLFDPGTEVLSAVQFKKPYAELRYQAFNAPLMLDRYDAITAMREFPVADKRDDLLALFAKNDFYAIQEEIIAQLANDDDKKSLAMLKTALTSPIASVRKAVVTNLKTVPAKLEKDIMALLNDTDYNTVETTLRFLAEKEPKKISAYLDATAGKYGVNKNIRIAWLELSYAQGNTAVVAELSTYVSSLYEFRTRNNTMQALRRMNYCDAVVANHLVDAYLDYNRRLSGPARGLLTTFLENAAYAPIVREAINQSMQTGGDSEKLNKLLAPKVD